MSRLGSGQPISAAPRNTSGGVQQSSGQPISAAPRNTSGGVQQTGITETLGAPGVVPTPAVSQEAEQAQEVLRAMGFVGQIANQIGGMAYQKRREREADNEQVKHQYRSQAIFDYSTSRAQFLQDIEDGKITVPDGVKVEDFAREYFAQRLTDAPEEYRKAYLEAGVPDMATALVKQQESFKQKAMDEDVGISQYNDDPETVISDLEVKYGDKMTLAERLEVATKIGLTTAEDQETFDKFAKPWRDRGIGENYIKALQGQLDERLLIQQGRDERDREDKARERIDTIYNEADNNGTPINRDVVQGTINRYAANEQQRRTMTDELDRRVRLQDAETANSATTTMLRLFNNNAPSTLIRQALDGLRPKLGEDLTNLFKRRLDSEDEAKRKEAEKQFIQKATDAQMEHIKGVADASLLDPTNPVGGSLTLSGQKADITNPITGEVMKQIELDPLIQDAFDAKVNFIKDQAPIEAAAPAIMKLSGDNGRTSTYFRNYFNAAWQSASYSIQNKQDEPAPQVIEAMKWWMQFEVHNQRVRDQIAPGDARDYLNMVERQYKYNTPGDMAAAVKQTNLIWRQRQEDPARFGGIDSSVSKAVDEWMTTDMSWFPYYGEQFNGLRNRDDLVQMVRARAESVVATEGVGAKEAVADQWKWAAENTVVVNGWAYYTGDKNIPTALIEKLPQMTDTLARWYCAQRIDNDPDKPTYAEDEGVEPGDIIIRPGPEHGTWQLWNAAGHRPVDRWRDLNVGVMNTADMIDLYNNVHNEEQLSLWENAPTKAHQEKVMSSMMFRMMLPP